MSNETTNTGLTFMQQLLAAKQSSKLASQTLSFNGTIVFVDRRISENGNQRVVVKTNIAKLLKLYNITEEEAQSGLNEYGANLGSIGLNSDGETITIFKHSSYIKSIGLESGDEITISGYTFDRTGDKFVDHEGVEKSYEKTGFHSNNSKIINNTQVTREAEAKAKVEMLRSMGITKEMILAQMFGGSTVKQTTKVSEPEEA